MISKVTGLLHTTYKQCFTDTGRLSSGDSKTGKVNIQQVPKLKKLRKCFKYLAGYKILTIDLAQAELVFLSSKAQDKKLMELNKGDIHSYLATKAWRKILGDETYIVSQTENTDKRTEFKNVVYGAVYGAGVQKIAETMNISLAQAELVMQSLREELPDTFKYMDNASKFAVDNGYIEFSKRTHSRRWFPDRSRKFIGKVKRAAINAPLQGECADAIKEAMVEVSKHIKRNSIDAKLLLQAHDELVYAFKDDDFPEVVKYIMTSTVNEYLEGVEMNATYHVEETWIK
jgi:DNA polymerase-1